MNLTKQEPDEPDPEENMSDIMRHALDMVVQMGTLGVVAVPQKPTMDMLIAGSRAGDVSVETVWRIYQAMLAAAD